MANSLTPIAPTLYSAAKAVQEEPVGILDAINMTWDNKGVAKGDTVDVPVAPARAASDFTPANVSSTGADATAEKIEVQISHSRKVSWHLTGEQQLSLENAQNDQDWIKQLVMQGMRTLRNEAEVEAWTRTYKGSSRAVGTAGTTPFASTIDILADVRKILRDNGSPMADTSLVCDTAAIANLQKLDIYQQANQNGTAEERRNGSLPRYFGMQLLDSAGVSTHTKGDATGYDLVGNEAVGQTTLAVDGSDSGTILAGDVIQFATDGNNYVAADTTQSASGAASGNIIINRPGLVDALTAADEGVTGNTYTGNVALERNAVVGIMRPPRGPWEPGTNVMQISDDFGLTYLMLDINQYGQRTWELHLAWGFKAVNSEFICTLMG